MRPDVKNHPRVKSVVEYAKKTGKLFFSPQSYEIELEEKESNIRRREGYNCEDINGFWSPGSFLTYIKGNFNGYKDGLEFGPIKAFDFLSLKTPWSGWVWVLDSFDHLSFEIVNKKRVNNKIKYKTTEEYEILVSTVTEQEKVDFLKENYYELAPHLWISKADPSCIYYDPKHKPYELKDGWSTEQVGEILSEWLLLVAGVSVPAELKESSY